MKLCCIVLSAMALTGCSSRSSTHTIEVAGSPEEIRRFVAAEKNRDGSANVTYRNGDGRAVFSVSTADALEEVADRATASRLDVESKSSSWSAGRSSSWSVGTNP